MPNDLISATPGKIYRHSFGGDLGHDGTAMLGWFNQAMVCSDLDMLGTCLPTALARALMEFGWLSWIILSKTMFSSDSIRAMAATVVVN